MQIDHRRHVSATGSRSSASEDCAWAPAEARARLVEAVALIRRLWSGEQQIDFDGSYYRLTSAKGLPIPTPPVKSWIGCASRTLRRLIARDGDGWIPNGNGIGIENLTAAGQHIDEELAPAGREPSDVRRVRNTIMKKLQPGSGGVLCRLSIGSNS